MRVGLNILLAFSALTFMASAALAAAKWQGFMWNYYHFDGQGFVAGPSTDGSHFLAVRSGAWPVLLSEGDRVEAVALPEGKGALAGICYIQSTGGKLASGPAYVPYSRMPVQISSGNRVVTTVETDNEGYFMTALAAGRYTVSTGSFKVEVNVEKEKTVLVPLRAGKRMVD